MLGQKCCFQSVNYSTEGDKSNLHTERI